MVTNAPAANTTQEGWLLKSLTSPTSTTSSLELFLPAPPSSLQTTGLTETQVEALILKFIWNRGVATGKQLVDQIRLPFPIIEEQMRRLKDEQLVAYKRSSGLTDYEFELSLDGVALAKRYDEQATYFGAAPVPFKDYLASVDAQSLTLTRPTPESLQHALSDISIGPRMMGKLGQALTAGRAVFIYGTPGNGKTCIAERVCQAFGNHIWIPRSISYDGDIVRLFDPIVHEEITDPSAWGHQRYDERWVCIERPTIIVGGELQMSHLEMTFNKAMGIVEAPIQLKSNCGVLVIDDFGRQRMQPDELLNRWIVPLEKRYDFQNLPSGKKIQVPFDQMLVFSTNLEPKDIVDEAFLRRIPYKIEVQPPSEEEFRKVFQIMASKLDVGYDDFEMDHLIETHYKAENREFRFCHPRDLLLQVKNLCLFNNEQPMMKREYLAEAVDNYFSMM